MARAPGLGGRGPQGVGRRPVDRASWPALILGFLPTCPPEPCSPPCPPSCILGTGAGVSRPHSPRVPRGHTARTDLWLGAQAAWSEEPDPAPPPLLLQRTPGPSPARPQTSSPSPAAPARPRPGRPSAVPPGPLIHWPRRLRTCPCLPSNRSLSLPNLGGQAAATPPLLEIRWPLCWK